MRNFSIDIVWAKIQIAITAVGGWLGYFVGGMDGLLIALLVFVILDYVTGLMRAIADRTLSSAIGFKGICRKIIIFSLVGVGHVLDRHVVGTGSALREFLHVDDLADAVIRALQVEDPPDWANVGSGEEVSIRELAEIVRDACGAKCRIEWDATRPDGTPRKLLDSSQMRALGWSPKISLREGVARTVLDYRREGANRRGESR